MNRDEQNARFRKDEGATKINKSGATLTVVTHRQYPTHNLDPLLPTPLGIRSKNLFLKFYTLNYSSAC